MSKPTVVVLDPYHPDAIALLQSTPWINVVLPDSPEKPSWHATATGLILRSDSLLTAADFERARHLRVVVKQGVGMDNIDLAAAARAGVAVHNTPALNSESVAELTLALVLTIARRIPELDRRMRNAERIVRSQTLGISTFRKTVGVVGMGNIGRVVASKFRGGCEASIVAYDPVAPEGTWGDIPHRRVADLDELLREADVVTLHVPLLDSTRGMIGTRQLEIMKDDAILVNASRGGIVDEGALYDAMKGGKLWGAVLDAMDVEPPTKAAYQHFLELGNVIMTPHVGASTRENQSLSGLAVVEILLAVLKGESGVRGKVV